MIPTAHEVLDEIDIIGGTVAIVKVTMWAPNQIKLKYKLISADLSDNPLSEWSFNSEDAAWAAFKNLCENVA